MLTPEVRPANAPPAEWSQTTSLQKCEAVLYHAAHDAYLPRDIDSIFWQWCSKSSTWADAQAGRSGLR
ncbi:hypothetical protein [Streptomyces sp. NPDC047009]|uniref:hypothetical protein n=1 Tax=Streptomyces sp. NPDC047009 TaxID=3154496 RepID=UPI0033F95D54